MESEDEFENAVFPDNIAKTSNMKSGQTHPKIVFRNYRTQNKDTLECEQVDLAAT